jgi:6-phosphogluconolactonase
MSTTWLPTSRGLVNVRHVNIDTAQTLLAQDIAQRLANAIDTRGFAVLSVSGGKSPVALFEALRVIDIDWSRVRVTLVDERCVPRTHPDSNALLVQTHLLQDQAAKAQLVFMITANAEPLDSPLVLAKTAGIALQTAGRADVLILGMGADGHTASLFPQAPQLADALAMDSTAVCMGIELPNPPANAPHARITQTLPQILSARHIVLPIAGADKRQTLEQAWAQASPRWPVSFVLHQNQTPVDLWLSI